MLSHAGKEAREIYKTLPWADPNDADKFDKVCEAFQNYCSPRKNIIYERYTFWNLQQEEGESIDAYLTRLKVKIDTCEYNKEGWPAAVRQELIRDKFIFGLTDDSLKERLLREASLTLSKAIEIAQRSESSKQQIKNMKSTHRLPNVDALKGHRGSKPTYCGQCGQTHKPKECPAYGLKCSICRKLHHFAKVCRNKTSLPRQKSSGRHQRTSHKGDRDSRTDTRSKRRIHEVQDSESSQSDHHSNNNSDSYQSSDEFALSPLQIEGIKKSSAWLTEVLINGDRDKLTVKLDTGAEVSVLPLHLYNKLQIKPPLKTTTMKLSAYGGSCIKPTGTCRLTCTSDSKVCDVKFYVAPVKAQAILGVNDCVQLGLVKRVCTLQPELLTKETIRDNYPNCFRGLGNLGRYHITMVDNCTPVVNPPRRVPHSLKQRLHHALDKNMKSGVLVKVDQPTDWVSNLVIVEKKNGSLRLCLDPRDLNKGIKREHYKIPTMQEIASEFAGKTVFSTLDLKDGYWQVQLDEDSSRLCTFNTPFGRYRFTRMPFGIKSASEVFQKKNEEAFAGIPGIHIVADDIIIAAVNTEEHDQILRQVLERANEKNIKFNFDKLQLRVHEVRYLGTMVTPEGIKPDPMKVSAIVEMSSPTDKAGIRRILGMINFLAAHIPNVSTITAPLRSLLKSDTLFTWGPEQANALTKIKELLSTAPVLSYFEPTVTSTIQADASQHGLGACLLQRGKPIAYASRSLSPAECNYAQIEKELLAIVFACQKFHHYIYGFQTKVQSDHKPLESIVNKPLHKVSPRLQRMLLKLQNYDLSIKYVKGKDLHVADTLSRAYLTNPDDSTQSKDLEFAIHAMIENLPVSKEKKSQLQIATANDHQLQQLLTLMRSEWPNDVSNVPISLREYWKVRHNLCCADNLIFMNNRIVIPSTMRQEILKCIHEGHMGIEKCKARARLCVYWPSMYEAIEHEVKKCPVCNKYGKGNQKEPMIPHDVPNRPWEKLGADYFSFAGKDYLLIVDYFSKYPEVIHMNSKTAEATVKMMRQIFSRHGIPNTLVADNMPFNSKAFKQFAKDWDFSVVTSSPNYAQSNGLAERNVQTIKNLLRKAKEGMKDEQLALLEFRNTPITGLQESPAQLLMSRRLRSTLPMTASMLQPHINENVKQKLKHRQTTQKRHYDKTAKKLPTLQPNDTVRYQGKQSWKPAMVLNHHPAPRSYNITTAEGTVLRRNRRQLKKTHEEPPNVTTTIDDSFSNDDSASAANSQMPPMINVDPPPTSRPLNEKRTRSGRIVRPPARYRDD